VHLPAVVIDSDRSARVPPQAEIARNSVLNSCFDKSFKKKWIGANFDSEDLMEQNDPDASNLPAIRLYFRQQTLVRELTYLVQHAPSVDAGAEVRLCGMLIKPRRDFDFEGSQLW